ncbi:MAG: PLDc N-terminal domain-containing protein [Ilumatobacteraceae bacterium]
MLLAAEFGTGQVLWSILWFFLFFLWIWLVITIFADIIRNHDMSGWAKALWALFIIFVPFLGVFIYLIVNGGSMNERAVEQAQAQQEQMNSYIRQTAGSASTSDQLQQLADMHNDGKLDDQEYAEAKKKVLNG